MKVKREASVAEYITEALLLLMKKKAYAGISITEVCAKAGVTRMSFYRHFASKDDILQKWITDITDDFVSGSHISYKYDTSEQYFIKLFTHMQEHKDICFALYKAGLIHLIKGEFDRIFLASYTGEYDAYKSYFLSGGIYNVFLLWLINGCKETPNELADKLVDILEK